MLLQQQFVNKSCDVTKPKQTTFRGHGNVQLPWWNANQITCPVKLRLCLINILERSPVQRNSQNSFSREQASQWNGWESETLSSELCEIRNWIKSLKIMSVPADDPLMSVMEQEYAMSSNVDPKNMQELTIYVSFHIYALRFRTPLKHHLLTLSLYIAGPELAAERPGQVPDHVRSDNLTHRRYGQSNRWPGEEHIRSDEPGWCGGWREIIANSPGVSSIYFYYTVYQKNM